MAALSVSGVFGMLKEAATDWIEDKATQQAAALTFYSVLSIAPLLVISLAVASLVFDQKAARTEMVDEMGGLIGSEGEEAVEAMLDSADKPQQGTVATILGVITLLFGASGVFGQLQDSLNTIWEVKPKPGGGIWQLIRSRFLSMAMVLGTGFLLLVSLVVSSAISGLGTYLQNQWPGLESIWHVVNFIITVLMATVLFALIFKFLPDAKIAWSDVWVGAFLTAVLFSIGKVLIGLYLGKASIGSAYGAAGSLVVLLVWIYYSSLILFFGAELTQVYAKRFGSQIVPKEGAEPVTGEARAQQGLGKSKEFSDRVMA
jgi:membrane protein